MIPNPLEDDTDAIYSDCSQDTTLRLCDGMGSLFIESIIPKESSSLGAAKVLLK